MPGGNSNTAVGTSALHINTGAANTGTGYEALYSNTNGASNTASGYEALLANLTGNDNTGLGAAALKNNTTGSDNTAVGNGALEPNTLGSGNTAVGSGSMFANTTGAGNVAVGFNALVGSNSNNNVAVGYQALALNLSGTNNIAIGYQAGNQITKSSNNIDIANPGVAGDSGVIRIGGSNQTSAYIAGVVGATTVNNDAVQVMIDSSGNLGTISSSRRYKEDIQDMGDASSGLLRLRPVTFRYKKPFADGSKPVQYGLIAEEVAEVYPDMVMRGPDGQIETVKYQLLNSMLLNELQKQNATITALEERVAKLEEALEKAAGK